MDELKRWCHFWKVWRQNQGEANLVSRRLSVRVFEVCILSLFPSELEEMDSR